jgi:ubiquinone/menaquinone biosynthesis C-methylase UbiE
MSANFDRIARVYRWLEYASFGHALERCRFHFLPHLREAEYALMLGDGDGRFLHRLLLQNTTTETDAVDASPAMLKLLRQRCGSERVTLHCTDALVFIPPRASYDCIAAHFFLDCLTSAECAALAERMVRHLAPEGYWVVSEFRVPRGLLRLPAALLIRAMYACFYVLTGLEIQHLPAYEPALRAAGLELVEESSLLHGLLVTQLWRRVSSRLN